MPNTIGVVNRESSKGAKTDSSRKMKPRRGSASDERKDSAGLHADGTKPMYACIRYETG